MCVFVCVCVCLCSHLATKVVIINIDREAERKRKREAEDKEGHTGWYSNPAGAATSKATIFKEGIGKYIADDKGKSAVVAAPGESMGGNKGKAKCDVWLRAEPKAAAAVGAEQHSGGYPVGSCFIGIDRI